MQYYVTMSVAGGGLYALLLSLLYACMAPFEDHDLGTVYRARRQAGTDFPVFVDAIKCKLAYTSRRFDGNVEQLFTPYGFKSKLL